MPRRRQHHEEGGGGLDGNQLLSLSLFVMLLAFFIILNALSGFEQHRSRPVIDSLEAAFSSKISQKDNEQPSLMPREERDIGEGDTFDRLEALFTSQIPSYKGTISRRNGVMHVALSYKEFKEAVYSLQTLEGALQSAFGEKFFLPALLSLMKNDEAGQPFRMDIMLHIEENPAVLENRNPAGLQEKMQDLAVMVDKIVQAGLEERFFSIGFEHAEPGTVELLFRPHIAYNPLADEAAHSGE